MAFSDKAQKAFMAEGLPATAVDLAAPFPTALWQQ